MITDSNSFAGFISNILTSPGGLFGGDIILFGIILFILIIIGLVLAKAKAGVVISVSVALAFLLSLSAPEFMFLFWIAIVVSLFVLIAGLRRWMTF
jgi:hypothetical protein